MLNELALDSNALRRLFLTDHSGFFSAGVLLYLHRRGERGVLAWGLLALSILVAAGQAQIGGEFVRDTYGVAISRFVLVLGALGAVGLVAAATALPDRPETPAAIRRPRLHLVIAALGGITYPLYLLHQNAGYIVFNRLDGILPTPAIVALTATIMIVAAWTVWRYVEPPCRRAIHRWFEPPPAVVTGSPAAPASASPAPRGPSARSARRASDARDATPSPRASAR